MSLGALLEFRTVTQLSAVSVARFDEAHGLAFNIEGAYPCRRWAIPCKLSPLWIPSNTALEDLEVAVFVNRREARPSRAPEDSGIHLPANVTSSPLGELGSRLAHDLLDRRPVIVGHQDDVGFVGEQLS